MFRQGLSPPHWQIAVCAALSVVTVVALYRGIASSPSADSDVARAPVDRPAHHRGSRREFQVELPPPNDHDFYAVGG